MLQYFLSTPSGTTHNMSVSDVIVFVESPALWIDFAETIIFTETFVGQKLDIEETIVFTETVSGTIQKTVTDTIVFVETITVSPKHESVSDTIVFTETISTAESVLANPEVVADILIFTETVSSAGSVFTRAVAEVIPILHSQIATLDFVTIGGDRLAAINTYFQFGSVHPTGLPTDDQPALPPTTLPY